MKDFLNFFKRLEFITNSKSDSDIARVFEISRQSVSKFKKAEHFPVDLIVNYCLTNNISLDWLFTGVGETNLQPAEKEITLKDVKRTLDKIESLLKKK